MLGMGDPGAGTHPLLCADRRFEACLGIVEAIEHRGQHAEWSRDRPEGDLEGREGVELPERQ
jgi:hypothetical protein